MITIKYTVRGNTSSITGISLSDMLDNLALEVGVVLDYDYVDILPNNQGLVAAYHAAGNVEFSIVLDSFTCE